MRIKVREKARARTTDDFPVAWLVQDGRGGWKPASVEDAVRAINRFEKVRYFAAYDGGGKRPSVTQGTVDPASLPMQYANELDEIRRSRKKDGR